MKQKDLYPKISAQIFPSNTNKDEFFLFNSSTNRGFSIDGLAAIFCKKFTGEKKLSELVLEFEKEQNIKSGLFNTEIENLINELENNKLITFTEASQQS